MIPCLNEEATIGLLVADVRRHLPTVFVIDDGSADLTATMAKKTGAEVLRHESTFGKGTALRTGWGHARKRGFKWALTLDGDGQHSPEDIPLFLRCAERGPAALVVGNRMANAQDMPWLRRWVNRWMSRRLSLAAGCSLPDSQCGFRLINLDVWSALPISTAHFEIESEVLLALIKAGHAVDFVPLRAIYKTGQSKIRAVSDAMRWFRWYARARKMMRASKT